MSKIIEIVLLAFIVIVVVVLFFFPNFYLSLFKQIKVEDAMITNEAWLNAIEGNRSAYKKNHGRMIEL